MDPVLTALLVGLTGLVGAAAALIRAFARKVDRERAGAPTISDDNAEVFRSALDATDALKRLRKAWKADYGVVMMAHNSGKPLRPHTLLYTSVLYEDLGDGRFESAKENWQRMPLDEHYTAMLHEMWASGRVTLHQRDGAHEQLQQAFATYGVKRVVFFRICEVPEARYYAAVSWAEPDPPVFEPPDRLEQDRALSQLESSIAQAFPNHA